MSRLENAIQKYRDEKADLEAAPTDGTAIKQVLDASDRVFVRGISVGLSR